MNTVTGDEQRAINTAPIRKLVGHTLLSLLEAYALSVADHAIRARSAQQFCMKFSL